MRRIKMMLMALLAVTTIGVAVGAGAVSADGTGRVTISAGGCDFEYTDSGWIAWGDGWRTSMFSIQPRSGGDCDVDEVSGTLDLTKYPVDEYGIGEALVAGDLEFRVLSGLVTCNYWVPSFWGSWHWTDHWWGVLSDPDIPHHHWNISNPGNPSTDDKMFHLSGTAHRTSGSALFCPTFSSMDIDIRDHYTH